MKKKPAVEFFTYSKNMVIFLKGFDKPFLQTNIKFLYLLKMTKLFCAFCELIMFTIQCVGEAGAGGLYNSFATITAPAF